MLNFEQYELKAEATFTVFEFLSEGPKGKIPKLVQYSETNIKDIFNLGFGDKDTLSDEIDDTVISNNDDSRKVLATVAATVYAFTEAHRRPGYMQREAREPEPGFTELEYPLISRKIVIDFEVYGLKNGEWVTFTPNADFDAFLLRRK
jgi:hypothetical protein